MIAADGDVARAWARALIHHLGMEAEWEFQAVRFIRQHGLCDSRQKQSSSE